MASRNLKLMGAAGMVAALCLVAGCPNLPNPNVRYIAFGDSSTTGTDEGRDYPDLLREMLGAEPATFANEGKGGEPSGDGLARLRRLLSAEFYPNATTLLYWEGGNDVVTFLKESDPLLLLAPSAVNYPLTEKLTIVLNTAEANIGAAIKAGQEAGLDVYVATYSPRPLAILPCKPLLIPLMLPEQAAHANEYTVLLNERIRRAVGQTGAVLVDVAADSQLANNPAFWENCNHFNEQGNSIAAGLFAAALNAASQPE